MGLARFGDRRTRGGDALAGALLATGEPLAFDDLLAAAPDCSPGEVAAWLGHAMAEGLVRETGSEFADGLKFTLRARGRPISPPRRRGSRTSRAADHERSSQPRVTST